jgi:DNA-binding GntR family transcriptional regulator
MVSSSERAYRELRGRILSGELAPSTRLVEQRVAEELAVSRTPVREALKRLMSEGLVRVEAGGRVVVRDIDPREVEETYVIREVLDGLAARLAAQRVSATQLARFHTVMEVMREDVAAERHEAVVQGNIVFHDLLHEASGNERLRELSRDLTDYVRRFSSQSFSSTDRVDHMLEEHQRLVDALTAHDGDRAEAVAREHVAAARQSVINRLITAAMRTDAGTTVGAAQI